MLEVKGYKVEDSIRKGRHASTFRALRTADNTPVVIKWTFYEDGKHIRQQRIFKNEFDIMQLFVSNEIIKVYEITETKDGCGLIVENFGGRSLRDVQKEHKLTLSDFLTVAIQIARGLSLIHEKDVIHKDINPANIITNPEGWETKISDFGIATFLSREEQGIVSPEHLEGTLAYISPEQTGRMNRMIDYRTDIYSLGVTFYEMLCEELPFHADDAVGWVHNHIAIEPPTVAVKNPQIPEVVSNIVRKMMAKNAEERYESAAGLLADLEVCRNKLSETGSISNFEIAQSDFSGQFQIPQKLYGREKEIKVLLDAFESTAKTGFTELFLVAGFSGIGKSALVNEVQKPIIESRGYFIGGKYDQFRRNIPYSAIIQACQKMAEQLVTESEERLAQWKSKLLTALGPNGQIIIDVIPEMELIIGKQPAVMELGPAETLNRFNATFLSFINIFAAHEHPLVIFLDDLQWADGPSLNLLEVLLTSSESKYLLIIGAYRDNEVDPSHPFMMMLNHIRDDGGTVHTVSLAALGKEHINHLVAESLQTSEEKVESLTEIVMEKTEGNPFFANELLRTLFHEEMLRFDFNRREWTFDADEIKARGITDNVVELMLGRMAKLPEETRLALQLGACIGNRFDVRILAIISEKTIEETATALWPAIQANLLVPIGEAKDVLGVGVGDKNLSLQDFKGAERFLHDRVHQAAYAMIPESEVGQLHLKIGRLLLESFGEHELEERRFDIIGQFNEGLELLTDESEKIRVGQLNFDAGKRALKSTAYGPAKEYLETAIKLLPENPWGAQPDLTFGIYRQLSECEYILGNHERAEKLFDYTLENSNDKYQKSEIYNLKIVLYFMQNNYKASINVALTALKMFGVSLSRYPSVPKVLLEVITGKIALSRRKIENLEAMPIVEDREFNEIIKLLLMVVPSGIFDTPNLFVVATMKAAKLSIKRGSAPFSDLGYAMFALVLSSALQEFDTAFRLVHAALKVNEKLENQAVTGKILHIMTCGVLFWRQPMELNAPIVKKGIQASTEVGDVQYRTYITTLTFFPQLLKSNSLQKLYDDYIVHRNFIKGVKDPGGLGIYESKIGLIESLQGKRENKLSFDSEHFNEEVLFRDGQGNQLGLNDYHITKLWLLYIFEDYEGAQKQAIEAEKILESNPMLNSFIPYFFYGALTLTALYPNASRSEKRKYKRRLKKQLKQIANWAKNCSVNFLHQSLLVQAEYAALFGSQADAMNLYSQAIKTADENEFLGDEALANELAGKFWSRLAQPTVARSFMEEAVKLYRLWGAHGKIQDLEERYPKLLTKDRGNVAQESEFGTSTTLDAESTDGSTSGGSAIDLGSVLKATRTMAGEIKLNRLLGTMMDIVMENAAARRGFLFLNREGELKLAARNDVDEQQSATDMSIPLSEVEKAGTDLAVSVVRFVARTKESLVINDAINDEKFSRDAYIVKQKPRSILCSPIVNQGRITGLLYLENNLSSGAFTQQRLEVLNMLSSQAAVSLENAVLYDNMEAKVEERTKEVKDILTNVTQGIFTINQDYNLTGGYSGLVPKIFEGIEFLPGRQLHLNELAQAPKLDEYLDMLFTSPYISQKLIENANPLKVYDYIYTDKEGLRQTKLLSFLFSRIFETDSEGKETKNVQKLMVVVDDKTEEFALKKELEQKAEEQAGKVEKLYQILQLDSSVFSNFISESSETLEQVFLELKGLGDDPEQNRESLALIFREVHTLKGNARALNLDTIGKTAHELEDIFEELKENPERITQELKDKTNAAVTLLKDEIQDGNSLFEKILNMQKSLQGGSGDAMSEFEERFRRIVEKEAKESGKIVEFEFNNELDAPPEDEILKKLRNPLSHIVRNSVSHGIENTEKREELQKPATGNVKLKVSRKDGALLVVCEDDGGGLDTARIRQKAETLELFPPETLKQMSDNEVNKLIFSSGLTTQEKVSDSAGRGVGMDVVKADLKALNAVISIGTKSNIGTRFSIRIPES